MAKILVVDDDVRLREELKTLLENNGYEVEVLGEFDGVSDVVAKIVGSGADLILLDINLPGINGESLLREVRKVVVTPVIMVTSQDDEIDELLSMSYGADDFVAKPYNANILLLRIEAVLRRAGGLLKGVGQAVRFRGVEYFPEKGEIRRFGEGVRGSADCGVVEGGDIDRGKVNEVVLTKNERLVFNYLLDNKNRIVSRKELMTLLWDNASFLNDSTLSVTISRLRDKLEKLGVSEAIETRKGQGYILEDG